MLNGSTTTPEGSTLADILRLRRKELGLTQYQIAECVGVPQGTVSRWERGDLKTTKDLDRLFEVARAYELNPSLLLSVSQYHNTEIPLLPEETLRALAQLSVEQIEAVTVFTRFLSQEGLDNAQWSQIIERFPEHVQNMVAAAADDTKIDNGADQAERNKGRLELW